MNVQNLNKGSQRDETSYKSFLLLDEISKGNPLSQRDLSRKLNIALGLVNSYLKNLSSKGLIKVSEIPAKRYAYYLTPKGFSEKSRLTYHYLQNYTSLYRNARRDFKKLFASLSDEGVTRAVFAGVDEVTEIAYLSLQETDIALLGVIDDERAGESFFKHPVLPFSRLPGLEWERVILTTADGREDTFRTLIEWGVREGQICDSYEFEAENVRREEKIPGGEGDRGKDSHG